MAVNNPMGGRMPADTVLALPPLIEDEPTEEFKTPFTIITPNREFGSKQSDVRLSRRFSRGKVVVYDPAVAWQFINDYGYKCEPMPPEPPKGKAPRQRARKTYDRARAE